MGWWLDFHYVDTVCIMGSMKDTRGNKMKNENENTTTWTECQCEACTSDEQNDGANGYENHQGDGPSGYDYYSDTRRWC